MVGGCNRPTKEATCKRTNANTTSFPLPQQSHLAYLADRDQKSSVKHSLGQDRFDNIVFYAQASSCSIRCLKHTTLVKWLALHAGALG